MKVLYDIPFEDVQEELIAQLNSCDYTYEDYLKYCEIYNELPIYWNYAIVDDDEIVVFTWGTFEPLEQYMHIVRVTMLKRVRNHGTKMLMIDCLETIRDRLGAKYVFCISTYADSIVAQSNGRCKIPEGKIVEVLKNENLY